MEQQNNNQQNQNQNNPPHEEKPYQHNSNVYNNNDEILKLQKEISNLKIEQNNNKEKINKLTQNFQNEIDKLKLQIKDLLKEINELKNNKNAQNINNENKDNYNSYYNNDEDENMDNDKVYSIECLSRNLNIDIDQGDERATIDVVIRNNSNNKYPNNSYLICDNKNSLLLCEKVQLNELEPNQQQQVTIIFKNLKCISKGKYKSIIKLQINNKVYNSFFEIIVKVIDNRQNRNPQLDNFQANFSYPNDVRPGGNFGNFRFVNMNNLNNMNDLNNMNNNISDIIVNFKTQFDLYNNDYITDEKIEEALKKNDFDFNKAFGSLYE